MRTTVDLAGDVAAAVERQRVEHGTGLSEEINNLIRLGLRRRASRKRFVQRTHDLGIAVDVHNVADALEQLEGSSHR
jgi:hypothetical protein